MNYLTGDCLICKKISLANYGSNFNPKIGDYFTIKEDSDESSLINSDGKNYFFLINSDGKELTYPYQKYELDLFFDKII